MSGLPGVPWLRTSTGVARFSLVGALAAVVVVFGSLRPGTFLSAANIDGILGSQAVLVVLTCGLLLPLIAGDYDLSVTGTLMLSQMMLGVLNAHHGWPVAVVIPLCLGMGAIVGLINGACTVMFAIDSFIVTLGIGTVLSGIVLWISDSMTFSGISPALTQAVLRDRILTVPLEFYYGVALTAIVWYFLEFTAAGRRLLFIGRSKRVALLSGIRVSRMRVAALVGSGVISAGAGVLYAGTTGAADPSSGSSFLLPAFAAAFLGATTITPGRFNPAGSFVAVYFLAAGVSGLTLIGVESYVQDLFFGGALVIAVILSKVADIRPRVSYTRAKLRFKRRAEEAGHT